jgi:hypothetical protein
MKSTYKYLVGLFVLMFAIFSLSCGKGWSDDERTTQTFSPDSIHTIVIRGVFDIHFIQDTVCGISITGVPKMMEKTTVSESNGTITISNNKRGEMFRPGLENTTVYVRVKNLRLIKLEDASKLICDNPLTGGEIGLVVEARYFDADLQFDCTTFYYWNNINGGAMKLNGQVQELKLWNTGLCSVNARDLQTNYALVDNGSQGDCIVNVNTTLEYSITGIGNIKYSGTPSQIVQRAITGTGQLIPLQ